MTPSCLPSDGASTKARANHAWTLGAEPLGPDTSLLVTRTRVVATDPQSRQKFRRYWAPMSAGIILIRYAGLPRMRNEAERRAAHAAKEA
jgi:hypothetical protein